MLSLTLWDTNDLKKKQLLICSTVFRYYALFSWWQRYYWFTSFLMICVSLWVEPVDVDRLQHLPGNSFINYYIILSNPTIPRVALPTPKNSDEKFTTAETATASIQKHTHIDSFNSTDSDKMRSGTVWLRYGRVNIIFWLNSQSREYPIWGGTCNYKLMFPLSQTNLCR